VSGPPVLVLWDVDRTLVTVDGVGRTILAGAFAAVTGRPPGAMPDFGGRTDRYLVSSLLAANGLPVTEELVGRLLAQMVSLAPGYRREMTSQGQALAGALRAIESLAGHPRVVQTLVTGNVRPIAELKLAVFGLDRRIDFAIGAYGSEHVGRAELVRLALRRAQRRYGTLFPPASAVVIGDTVHDIAGAREAGVRSVGVATGRTPAAELTGAGADLVLADLTDTGLLVPFVLAG
jgi:phosphoglycolate phosphatase